MDLWVHLGLAIGLGLLVGLQRERAEDTRAGIRTFPLITLLGAICGLLTRSLGAWALVGGFLALASLLVLNNLNRRAAGERRPGPTTEIAALLMFAIGATLVIGPIAPAVAAGGLVVLLLQWKQPLHRFVSRIGEAELRAVFRMVLIGLVVLPALPDRTFGPYDVLNPFRIWLVVVLIVGISLGGFLASRLLGPRAGSVLAGIFGGIISSTATTVSYSRKARENPAATGLALLVIMIASTVVFLRVGAEVAVTAPGVLPHVVPQLSILTLYMALLAGGVYFFTRVERLPEEESGSPSDLPAAVIFGLLYAAVLFGVAAAKEHFGDRGLYVVAALSGLTDMDAITLSTAQLMDSGRVDLDVGWRMMLTGALSNLVFKGLVVAALGPRRLLGRIVLLFALSMAGGGAILYFWPKVG